MLRLLNEARDRGLDITYDVYPYTAAGSTLNEIIPLWAQEGGHEDFMARLARPGYEPARGLRPQARGGRAAAVVGYVACGLRGGWKEQGADRPQRGGDRGGLGRGARGGSGQAEPGGRRGRGRGHPQQGGERRQILHDAADCHVRFGRQGDLPGRSVRRREAAPEILRHVSPRVGAIRSRAGSLDAGGLPCTR